MMALVARVVPWTRISMSGGGEVGLGEDGADAFEDAAFRVGLGGEDFDRCAGRAMLQSEVGEGAAYVDG